MITSKMWMTAWVTVGALALVPALAQAAQKKSGSSSSSKAQVVEMAVTDSGFFLTKPVNVKAGQPVKLVVTRKTNRTCATELLLQDYGIKQPLPLNETVEVTFTPEKAGPIRYSCGMGMTGAALVAQ
jgi:plastocyanin domain-containing protein